MKLKVIFFAIAGYCFFLNAIFSDDALTDKWIKGWDQAAFEQTGYNVAAMHENRQQDSFDMEMSRNGFSLKLTVNNVILFKDFIRTVYAVDKAFNGGKIFIDKRGYGKIKFKSVEIIYGTTGQVLVLPKLEKLILIWDQENDISLDLTEKVKENPVFRYDLKNHDFTYNINYINRIKMTTGTDDVFRGWSYYLENLFFTLRDGIKNGDYEARDMVNTALINIDILKFRSKRRKSDLFYLSIENYEACILSDKSLGHENYIESRIDSKILTAFSLKNLGASGWIYKPFGVEFLGGIFADANISTALRGAERGIFDILKTGPCIGLGCSVGIPVFEKDKQTGTIRLLNIISAFSFETIFNINVLDMDYHPLTASVIFGLDLFPGYLAYLRLFVGLTTDGVETGFTAGAKLIFDINLPKPRMAKNNNSDY